MFKSNRKKVVAAAIFAGLLVLSVFAMTGTAEPADKVTICHCTNGTPAWVLIEVSGNAWLDGNARSHVEHACFSDIYGPTIDAEATGIVDPADCVNVGLP